MHVSKKYMNHMGGGPVPLTGTDVSNGDRCLPVNSKKLRFLYDIIYIRSCIFIEYTNTYKLRSGLVVLRALEKPTELELLKCFTNYSF